MVDPFPLHVPPEARRLFQGESILRRFAVASRWDERSKLVELYPSTGGLALCKALKCTLTTLEPDARSAEAISERVKTAGIASQVKVLVGSVLDAGPLPQNVDGFFSLGRVLGHLDDVAKRFRGVLTPSTGRMGVTTVVRVGRQTPQPVLDVWKERLGRPLLSPREAMMLLESEGFEPEICESLGEPELDEFYRDVKAALQGVPDSAEVKSARAEVALHEAHGGKTGVTYALIIARRKEPGEKPPVSRDNG